MQQELPGLDPNKQELPKADVEAILAAMDNPGSDLCDSLILTPNQSLAQQLRRIRLTKIGAQSAPAASIQVFSAWLSESVSSNSDIDPSRSIASEQQLRLLMQQALTKSQSQHPDLNLGYLAPSALSAWRDLKRFEVSLEKLRTAETGQEAYFSDTVEVFEDLLKSHALTTLELEIERLLKIDTSDKNTASKLWLYAFANPFPPLIKRWINHCFAQVQTADFLGTTSKNFLRKSSDEQAELCDAAHWANCVLTNNPQARIGIVYRALGENLNRARRIVQSGISQHALSSSLRPPASKVGSIRSALGLLQLNRYQLTHAEARFIFQTPFWGDDTDYQARSDWDTTLCHTQLRHIKPARLRELLQPEDSESHKSVNERLLAFADLRRRAATMQSAESWAELFCDQLRALGWPTPGRSRDTDTQLWLDVLGSFASCSKIAPEISVSEALNLLSQCCEDRRTDPRAAHSGVRLLDTAESAADFTHLWVIGVDNNRWPARPSPNPLLPVRLQGEYQMPGASRGQETALAEALITRLAESATEVVFSYSEQEDGATLAPSALLPDSLKELEFLSPTSKSFNSEQVFEYLDTGQAPKLLPEETQVRGGANLLASVAQSPFLAFAQWRLHAIPLPTPKIGLDARDRGNLVHQVLENIWRKLQSQRALIATSDSDLQKLCQAAAEAELQRWQRRAHPLPPAVVKLETNRLVSLCLRWLALEATRPPFEVVHIEEALRVDIGGLTLGLRLDRMDRLDDGSLMLIDYKTGRSISPKRWTELPPSEPQLPLYAISLPEPPDAICFAQVRPDSLKFAGLGSRELSTGVSSSEDWVALQEQWRDTLRELAEAYAQGDSTSYETAPLFGQSDPFAPLHRFAEYDDLHKGGGDN